jgi:hypothetical protein
VRRKGSNKLMATFFQNNAFDVEGDLLEQKIREEAPLEELFLMPIFLDQLTYQHENLIEYLKKSGNIHKMVWFLRVLAFPDKYSENRCFHYPYFAYMVLSTCTDDISFEFINDDAHLDDFFGVSCHYNDDVYDTSFGYFQGVLQKLISQNNSHNKLLIEKMRKKAHKYVYPFVAIMNKASSEFLFDVVGYQEEGFGGFKEELFRHTLESFLEYSVAYTTFQSIRDEIAFWQETLKKKGVEGRLNSQCLYFTRRMST